jgi:hypothetical protein
VEGSGGHLKNYPEFPEGTEENLEKPHSAQPVSWL